MEIQPCPQVGDLDVRPLPPDPFMERCKVALMNFKTYVHGAACATARNALAVVCSLYPTVKLEIVNTGFTDEMSDDDAEKLMEEVTELAFKLVEDLDLFDEKEQQNKNN